MEIDKKFYRNECDGELTANGVYAYARVNFADDDYASMLVSEYDSRVWRLRTLVELMKISAIRVENTLDNVPGYDHPVGNTSLVETGARVSELQSLIFYDAMSLACYMQGKGAEISY